LILGAHQSIAGGVDLAFGRGEADGCESVQIFTRGGRTWLSTPTPADEVLRFRSERRRTGIPVIAHGSYLVNLASEDARIGPMSRACFIDELQRADALGCVGLVIHPGSHPNEAIGIARIADAIREALVATRGSRCKVLLEGTAGQGTCIGHRFEHLAQLLDRVGSRRVGICLDTCHLFAAGYDISTPASYRRVMEEFETIIGSDLIHAFHLNDCKKPLGCRVDRHAEIGKGTLGLSAFRCLVNDARLEKVVGVLETPAPENYRKTLRMLRKMREPGLRLSA
jgi:deoxyribonuclease-4